MTESGDYRGRTLSIHLSEYLGVSQYKLDLAVFYKRKPKVTYGSCTTYVYNTPHTGNETSGSMSKETDKKSYFKERNWDDRQFIELPKETTSN